MSQAACAPAASAVSFLGDGKTVRVAARHPVSGVTGAVSLDMSSGTVDVPGGVSARSLSVGPGPLVISSSEVSLGPGAAAALVEALGVANGSQKDTASVCVSGGVHADVPVGGFACVSEAADFESLIPPGDWAQACLSARIDLPPGATSAVVAVVAVEQPPATASVVHPGVATQGRRLVTPWFDIPSQTRGRGIGFAVTSAPGASPGSVCRMGSVVMSLRGL